MYASEDLNKLIIFLAKRDMNQLNKESLNSKFGIEQVDLIIILGSAIPYIATEGAKAYKSGLAKKIMIVGGIGHSTKYLVNNIEGSKLFSSIKAKERAEADILCDLLVNFEGIDREQIIIENKSTNCGSNAAEALRVLNKLDKIPETAILLQDPTMQLRSFYCFKKEWNNERTKFIGYSPFIPLLKGNPSGLKFIDNKIYGLWDMKRFISLVLGEIPRLKDDRNGYGPKGKGFIDHVDIPDTVLSAYKRLISIYKNYETERTFNTN